MRFAFLTATPLNPIQGSGTFAGVAALAGGLRALGHEVEVLAPDLRLPTFTLRRLWFNEQLRQRRYDSFDLVAGFDMDGYRVAGRADRPHIASIKGVIADEMRFERGLTRLSLSLQATCERRHVRRADLVVTTSRYAANRLGELYGLSQAPVMVPELIDLGAWRELFRRNPARPNPDEFTVLSVGRFYPRKRFDVLLEAAALLRSEIPALRVRIVGGGPERARLRSIWHRLRLEEVVHWIGDLSQDELAREYNRCDVFAHASVQEGFGIVFLEAMAAGRPIVAARAGAVPEVVEHGLLVEPDSAEALAGGLLRLYQEPGLRANLAEAGSRSVLVYNTPEVSQRFLTAASRLL